MIILKRRSRGVSIIALLNIIIAIQMFFIATLIAIEPKPTVGSQESSILPSVMMFALTVLGIAYFLLAYSFFRGRRMAWRIMTILVFLGIPINIVSVLGGNIEGAVGLIIGPAILYYLFRPHVKTYFGITSERVAVVENFRVNVGEKEIE
ncbi:MAG: hypothetical protein QXU32_07695 [Nitrososphaerales archaeon]